MSINWEDKYFPAKRLITLTGSCEKIWNNSICYACCKLLEKEGTKSRFSHKLARALLALSEVNTVTLTGNIVMISLSETITQQRAFEITQATITILAATEDYS